MLRNSPLTVLLASCLGSGALACGNDAPSSPSSDPAAIAGGGVAASGAEEATAGASSGADSLPSTESPPGAGGEPDGSEGSPPLANEGGMTNEGGMANASQAGAAGSGGAGGAGGAPVGGAAGAGLAMGGQTAQMPEDPDAGPEPGLQLSGTPPEARSFESTDDFDLLAATPEFSRFVVEGDRVQVRPLEDENWPPDFDWRNAPGRDAELNERHLWARAELSDSLDEWYYDVTLDYCGESDGESPFALAVNGAVVADFEAEPSESTSCSRREFTWQRVAIPAGASVQIWGKSHSNLTIEEGAGERTFSNCPEGDPDPPCTWAWARGRWYGVEFTPSADAP